jgi:cation:H+ antiporter
MDLAVAAAGLAILLGAGDALVRGAVALSLRLGVPALIVSLTIVAFGTSAPELLIAIEGALANADGIVYGNVVGSNIANILLVLGAPALISRLDARESDCFRNYVLMLAVSGVFIGLCWAGPLGWPQGLLLLAILGYMLGDAWRVAQAYRRAGAAEAELAEGVDPEDAGLSGWRITLFILAGMIGLPAGAHMLIDGARGVAETFGVSEAAIGLTLVAVGTSLPELATTVAAAIRKHADVAIGNVIGSNIFNIVAVMGAASLFAPLTAPARFLSVDLWVMLAASVVLFPFVRRMAVMGRRVGVAFLALYVAYAAAAFAPNL